MSNVGAELKRAREEREKTRAEVARETGILIHHLAALEHGNFDALPDDDTVAGFVRTYADYLGFVADEPVAEFWAERRAAAAGGAEPAGPSAERERSPAESAPESTATVPPPKPATSDRAPKRRALWPWLAAGAAVILAVLWLGTRGGPETEPIADGEPMASEVGAEPETTVDAEPSTPESAPAEPAPTPRRTIPPEPPPTHDDRPARSAPASDLAVTEHGVGSAVEGRRLVGRSDRFRLGDKVWFWTRVEGGSAGDRIHHVWIREGRDFATVTLNVGSSNWRTQSAKTMFDGSVGNWAVEARDDAGTVLARSEFTCER